MKQKIVALLDAYQDWVIAGLQDVTRTLEGTYKQQYWRGYEDGFSDASEMKAES